MFVRTRFPLVAGTLLISLVLVGCASEGGEVSTPSKSPESSQEAEPDDIDKDRLTTEEFEELVGPKFLYGGDADATYADGWDYSDCTVIESTPGKLTESGCEYALESHFVVEEGDLQFSVLLVAPSQSNYDHATKLQNALNSDGYELQDDATIDDADAEQAESDLGSAGTFAGVVVGSTTDEDIDLDLYMTTAKSFVRDLLAARAED